MGNNVSGSKIIGGVMMRLKSRILSIYTGIKNSMRRFPITIMYSILLTILLIYSNESTGVLARINLDKLNRVELLLGMGILLSLNIDLLKERFFKDNKLKAIIFHIIGMILLVLYYFILLKEIESFTMIRYIGIMIFLFTMFFYIPRINGKTEDYEYYVINIFLNIALTAIYSVVLLWGIFAIIFTINSLFDAGIKGDFYYYAFLIIFFIFGISFFLSKVPETDKDFTEYNYSKALRVLLSYIVIPLISIYTIILYVYFVKILISWEWPKGLVSHLVLWYSSISVGVIFLINKITDKDRVANLFKEIYPKIILPILLMMFISIGQRINQYGITENRYYILVLGIWVTSMMLYISFKKPINTIIIPISLSLIVLNSVVGPISGFAISKYSQNRRLNNLLEKNNILESGEIIKNTDIAKEDKKEISNIIYYFENNHSLQDIKVLEDGFKSSNMEEVFGFPYEPHLERYVNEREYFYINSNISEEIINIKDYDYYFNIDTWETQNFNIDNSVVNYNSSKNILSIKEKNNILKEIDLKERVQDIYDNLTEEEKESEFIENMDHLKYEIKEENLNLMLLFNNMSGRLDESGGIKDLDGIGLYVFIKTK